MVNAPEIDLDEINREICGLTAPGVVESFDRQGLLLDTGVVTKMWTAVQKEKEDSGLTKVQTLWDKFHELFEKKDFESIPDLMDKILATGNDQKFASFYKAYALDELDRYEEAITCCGDALDIDPKYVRALNCKGLILYDRLSKYPEALECYNKALELEPKNNESLFLGSSSSALL
jgi:tetratricopeptide (TPR) repeat protein